MSDNTAQTQSVERLPGQRSTVITDELNKILDMLTGACPKGGRTSKCATEWAEVMDWAMALNVCGRTGRLASKVRNGCTSTDIFWNIVVGCVGSLIGNSVAGPLRGISGSVKISRVQQNEMECFCERVC
jgi:uncharacterized membrane protein YeaQ/YmgE (transglycosylase-associated protein family)